LAHQDDSFQLMLILMQFCLRSCGDFHTSINPAPDTASLICAISDGILGILCRMDNRTAIYGHIYTVPIRNEHTNGLLRQHLLKQRVFDNLSQKQVNKALALLNNRPRKSLDCQTSKVAFELGTIQPKKFAFRI